MCILILYSSNRSAKILFFQTFNFTIMSRKQSYKGDITLRFFPPLPFKKYQTYSFKGTKKCFVIEKRNNIMFQLWYNLRQIM